MAIYMLDTNTVSNLLKRKSAQAQRKISSIPQSRLCVSAITQAELLYGIARYGAPTHWSSFVNEFLFHTKNLAWDSNAANSYAHLRAQTQRSGKSLATMDMLIAAHSLAAEAILVTSDRAFYQFTDILRLEDWTKP